MIYVYALIDPSHAAKPEMRGLHDRPVQMLRSEGIAAMYTETDAPIAATPENLWRHEQVVESFMPEPSIAILPARFGTTFNSHNDAVDVLSRHRDVLAPALEEVRGCVEIGLRITAREPSLAAPPQLIAASGREYMLARLADEHARRSCKERAAQLAAKVNSQLAPLARRHHLHENPAPPMLMNGAYLVARDRTSHFTSHVNQFAAAHSDVNMLCTGPWPPYHFAPSLFVEEALHACS